MEARVPARRKNELEVKRSIQTTISLPQQEPHSGLEITISEKIVGLVETGITDTTEIKHCLIHYVDKYLSKELGRKPHLGDRAFYPLSEDIRNHVSKAKSIGAVKV